MTAKCEHFTNLTFCRWNRVLQCDITVIKIHTSMMVIVFGTDFKYSFSKAYNVYPECYFAWNIDLGFRNFKQSFRKVYFLLVGTFSLKLWSSVWAYIWSIFNRYSTSMAPGNIKKSFGFLMLSKGIKVKHWLKMGQTYFMRT